MDLYEKSKSDSIDKKLFEKPSKEFRGTPFWSWNCKLDEETIKEQIKAFKEMGFGGYHIHSRTGMAEEYLGERFMNFVKYSLNQGIENDMLTYLYDEDRYSSGFAGGYVTKHPKFRAKTLNFTVKEKESCLDKNEAKETGKPYLLAVYDVVLNEKGEIEKLSRIKKDSAAEGTKWYAYIVTSKPSPWFNNYTMGDLLDRDTTDEFIKITYGAYKEAVGDEFGKNIPSMFTDEPHAAERRPFGFANSKEDNHIAWTYGLEDMFKERYGYDILDRLPEVLWNLKDNAPSKTRYHYHDFVCELIVTDYLGRCQKACHDNNLMFTGHVMAEEMPSCQTEAFGEVMRAYKYFDIPGIDVLCDTICFYHAKQCQSAVHQYGKQGMACELYGVTNWKFDFRGHKNQGDWLAALGTTVRVPHLAWVSMAGEGKRDYPASIGEQSPWYKEYSYIEDHFARVNTALTRGKARVRVGMIHPIETMWMNFGPDDCSYDKRAQIDENFKSISDWLLFGGIDFDYISESLLPEQFKETSDGKFRIGEMEYDAVVIPNCEMLRGTTFEALQKFIKNGGKVINAGKFPQFCEAEYADGEKLLAGCTKIDFDKVELLRELEDFRDIKLINANGKPCDNLLYNMRDDKDGRWLFVAHGKYAEKSEDTAPQRIKLVVYGRVTPILYNTLNGKIEEVPFVYDKDKTIIDYVLYSHDSVLLKLENRESDCAFAEAEPQKVIETIRVLDKVEYERSEPNVLLLDRAEFALNGEAFNGEEEVLKIDNICRAIKGWPRRSESFAQPWTVPEEEIKDFVTLKYKVNSEVDIDDGYLAVEDAEKIEISFNGAVVASEVCGYFADRSIKKVKLPTIKKGVNELVLTIPFGKRTNIEWCYILGEFNVKVEGAYVTLIETSDKIGFADLTTQGMPFYGGNIVYKTEIETPNCDLKIHTVNYRGALVKVYLDGEELGISAFSPYEVSARGVKAGKHKLEYKLFGTRINTFGGLHNITKPNWVNSEFWRTVGDNWCYEYMFWQTGILSAPYVEVVERG